MVIINKKTGTEFKVLDREESFTQEELKNIIDINEIVTDIYESWEDFPSRVKSHHAVCTSYFGTLSDAIECIYGSYRKSYNIMIIDKHDILKLNKSKYEIQYDDKEFDELNNPYFEIMMFRRVPEVDRFIEDCIKSILKEDYDLKVYEDSYDPYYGSFSKREEWIMNSWIRVGCSINYKMVQKKYDESSEKFHNFESIYIPSSGPANTVFGELLRCCQRVIYRFFNDGDKPGEIYGANIISYVNIPYLLENIEGGSECDQYFIDQLDKIYHQGSYWCQGREFCDMGLEMDTAESCVSYTIDLEKALIETKDKYPEFLSDSNHKDSRWYLE